MRSDDFSRADDLAKRLLGVDVLTDEQVDQVRSDEEFVHLAASHHSLKIAQRSRESGAEYDEERIAVREAASDRLQAVLGRPAETGGVEG